MKKDNKPKETAQEILDGFKMKFMIAITVLFFGSMIAAFIVLFFKSHMWDGVYCITFNFFFIRWYATFQCMIWSTII